MVDQNVFEFSFQRKNQATNIQTTGVVIGEETNIDPQVLFQRLIAIKDHHDYSLELFEYELCGYSPALFDRYELPKEANKPQIADAVWEVTKSVQTKVPSDKTHFVIDGGALLQIPWQRGVTYDHIYKTYVQYVEQHYGKQVTIVFDGYQHGLSTWAINKGSHSSAAQNKRSWTTSEIPKQCSHKSQEGHFSIK